MNRKATISCLTFDLDDTLWEVYPVIIRAERIFYEWLETHHPSVAAAFDLKSLISHRQAFFKQFESMNHDFTWLRRAWLDHICEEYHCANGFAEEGFHVFWKARNEVTFFDGVWEMLAEAREHYRLISITNGNADIRQVGLGDFFSDEITAARVGAAKPDPMIFEAALAKAGVPAHQVVHIGDDPVRDVQGAASMGMKTIWMNIAQQVWPGGPEADRVVTGINQLLPAIKSL